MKGLPLSRAASGLFRALLDRIREEKHRILLIDFRSTDWQSLTLSGERHVLTLRVTGPTAGELANRLTEGIEEAEFDIPCHIVADIAAKIVDVSENGSVLVTIEALTICE